MNPLVMGLVTGGANLLGSIFSSDTSASNTQAQIAAQQQFLNQTQEYNTQMSNTAYQRASTDMKAAGLNPAMMFGSGSAASSPQLPTPTPPVSQSQGALSGIGKAVNDGVNSAIAAKTIDKMTDEIANLQTQRGVLSAETDLIKERTSTQQQDTLQRSNQNALLGLSMPGARFSAKQAEDLESMPDWLRKTLVIGSFTGNKASDAIGPIFNSARSLKGLLPQRSTSETTHSDGGSTFNERWSY